jgi:hypothetical protein
MVVRQQQADEDEGPSKPSDDHVHFHERCFVLFGLLMKAAGHQRPEDSAAYDGNERVAGQRTSAGRATDQPVVGVA